MAPLPANNTERFKVFYTAGGHQHTQEIRTDGISPAALGTSLDAYYTALGTIIYTTTIDQVQYASSGSNIFNAVTTGIEGNTYGSGTPAVAGENAYYYDFVGRSSGGRRVRFGQFGAKGLGGDYRFVAGESAELDAALVYLDATPNTWLAIDGIPPVWKTYVNAGANAYWQRALRP
jgi:hypothetical protein